MPTVNDKSLHASPGQLVKIPDQFKKHVRGPGGDNLRNVSTLTGAEVSQREDHQLYVRGKKKEVEHAEYLLRTKVVSDVSWAAQTEKHLLLTQNVSEQNQKHFLCPGHKICVRGQTGKHLCRQQCVCNNVSSFARALSHLQDNDISNEVSE